MVDIDQTVVRSLMAGEDSAYEAVVDSLYESVYRFALRLCGDSATAGDVTQETFLAVWQDIKSFKGKSRFTTWVFGIAYRQVLSACRKQATETAALDRWQEPHSFEPQESLRSVNEALWIRAAVESLPDPCRHVVLLVHVQGLNYREAAQVLNVPVGTVKSRMNNAYSLLRCRLEKADEVVCNEVRQLESLPRW
ncbi:MAG: hypothetical protein A2Z18_11290 [Armatimonadetes bacterium RBG_16_58_9]|nr:MAG: hypothetical protein A2Z18_11290 [Armatimonadetes bacterium RBG_16_58_9]